MSTIKVPTCVGRQVEIYYSEVRGEIIYKILDFFEDRALDQVDFISAFLKAGYGASSGKIQTEINIFSKEREASKFNKQRKRQLQKYISKLKSQGLVVQDSDQKIKISPEGREKLNKIRKTKTLDKNSYHKESGNKVIIVSYDIPTTFNRERDLIREVLKILEFRMIHQSVWVGKIKLPEKFIKDLEGLKILEYIEILEVTKQGTLKSL